MANYVKITDFASKDALATGNPLKLIKGTEINDELNAIQTAVATKADLSSPAFTGNPTATTQAFGNSSTRLATTAFVQDALKALYPIGTIYTSVVSTNPATLFGFGTWVAFATGRTLIGFNASDPLFDSAEETGGSKDAVVVAHTHTTTITDPGHSHTQVVSGYDTDTGNGGAKGTHPVGSIYPYNSSGVGLQQNSSKNTVVNTTGISAVADSTGVSGSNANLPPYIVVYMWKRTA